MTRSAIGDEAKDPSSSRDGFLGEEKPKGYDVSKMLPTPGRDGSPTPVASFAAGTFSPRQISARKPPLSPASRRVAKPAGGVETGAAKPSSLSPAKEERANDPAWKLDLPSGLPTAAERAEYESGGAPAGTSELEDAKQSEEPVKVADAPSMGALTAGAAAAGVLAAGAAVAGGLTAGAAAVGVLTPGAAAAGVLTAGAAAAAGAMTAGALETKAESGEGAALEHSGLEPVGADEAAERTGGTAVQAESGPAVESGEHLKIVNTESKTGTSGGLDNVFSLVSDFGGSLALF